MATNQELYAAYPPTRGGRGAPSMFPRKLFQILAVSDPKIIGWDKCGTSFHIADQAAFVDCTMPKFYRHNKLTSFQRQLNLYGKGEIWGIGRERERGDRRVRARVCLLTLNFSDICGALARCWLRRYKCIFSAGCLSYLSHSDFFICLERIKYMYRVQ